MKHVVCLGLVCALLCPAPPPAIGAASLQADILVRARFGDAPDEYGSSALVAAGPISVLVPAFDVTPDGIFVFDQIQKNIKVYTLEGEYQRTIRLASRLESSTSDEPSEAPEALLEARDILVVGAELHLLVDTPQSAGDRGGQGSRFQVLSFDIDSGAMRARHVVNNPKVGTTVSMMGGTRSNVTGTVELSWQEDALVLFDRDQQLSYPVTGGGDEAGSDAAPRVGSMVGPHRVRENHKNGTLELLDDRGRFLRALPCEGVPVAFASDTEHYITSRMDTRPGVIVTVYSATGLTIGEAVIPFRGRWENNPPSYWARFELHDGSLYEILVNDDGVHVVRWYTDLALR